MHFPTHLTRRSATVAIGLAASMLGILASAQNTAAPPSATVRLRGTVLAVSPDSLTIQERRGEVIELALSDKLVVSEVYPIKLEDIQAGSFICTAAMPQTDGSHRAIAVTVFPESARGTGEGHRPFDLQPQSTMTNATVADVAAAPTGRTLKLKYKDGEKTLIVPQDAPIVTFKPSDRSLLLAGASVSIFAQSIEGKPTALRINAGRSGFALPY
jgi:hypothetical protein